MLGFHAATLTEANYFCIDTTRTKGFIRTFTGPIPQQIIDMLTAIDNFAQFLNFLNIQIKIEIMMIITNNLATYFSSTAEQTWLPTVLSKIPDFSKSDLYDYHSGC